MGITDFIFEDVGSYGRSDAGRRMKQKVYDFLLEDNNYDKFKWVRAFVVSPNYGRSGQRVLNYLVDDIMNHKKASKHFQNEKDIKEFVHKLEDLDGVYIFRSGPKEIREKVRM